jgi:hypothetical protein
VGNGLRALPWERAEALLVVLVALHTFAVGAALTFATEWTLSFGGFPDGTPVFFPRQGGAFHIVVAVGYLLEYSRNRGVTLMLFAKTLAVVFLGASLFLAGEHAWSVGLSAVGDGAMALVVAAVHARVGRERARRGA